MSMVLDQTSFELHLFGITCWSGDRDRTVLATTVSHHDLPSFINTTIYAMSSRNAPMPLNLLKYHRPKIRWNEARIPPLSKESKKYVCVCVFFFFFFFLYSKKVLAKERTCYYYYRCLRGLVAYQTPPHKMTYPRSLCAAVLVALFVGRHGDLYVLLSR